MATAVAALLKRQYVYKGQRFPSLNAVAEFANIPYAMLRHRVKKLKMPLDEAVTLPVKKLKTGQVYVFGKIYKNLSVAAKAYDRDPDITRLRVYDGLVCVITAAHCGRLSICYITRRAATAAH